MAEPDEEYRDIYQMYEEMLQLVKNDFNSPVKVEEEQKDEGDEEDEGFNDERDNEWDKE